MRETLSINKGLTSLGDVICALINKDKHVPYRNSKLTFLLHPFLGQTDCRLLMIVNVSPLCGSVNETLNSLRFANKVINGLSMSNSANTSTGSIGEHQRGSLKPKN